VRVRAIDGFPFSRVARCTLEHPGGAVPSSVIVRLPWEDGSRAGAAPLDLERAALQLLANRGSALAPRHLAGGAADGILVTEDLGPHPSLLDLLLGQDRNAAEEGLLAFARGLGELHAVTAGQAPPGVLPGGADGVAAGWQQIRGAVAALNLPPPDAAEGDVEAIVATLRAPGPYLALSSGDLTPVNCKILPGAVRFFDFEYAAFRHALLDATVLRYLYPTGGPPWLLPPEVAARLEPAYREALAPACPAVLQDDGYQRGMALASAAWTILRLARLERVQAGPDRDRWPLLPPGWSSPIPTRSRRGQLLSILETGIASARRADSLDGFATWGEALLGALRARWPEGSAALPRYPVFA
jgi:Phosphotransferase enzyme family